MIKRMFLRIVVWTLAIVSIAAFVAIPVTANYGVFVHTEFARWQLIVTCGVGGISVNWYRPQAMTAWQSPSVAFEVSDRIYASNRQAMVASFTDFSLLFRDDSGPHSLRLAGVVRVPLMLITVLAGAGPVVVLIVWMNRRRKRQPDGFPVETVAEGK